jgi:hypothetical protein
MRRIRTILFFLSVVIPVYAAEPKAPEPPAVETRPPQPVPDTALLPDAEFLVHDFFKTDFSNSDIVDRARLVQKLLREAAQTNTDMDLKYVLIREAYDTARKSGQFELAMDAARAMAASFQVDGTRLKTDVFSQVNPTTPEGQQALLDCILHEVDTAVAADRYTEALQLLELGGVWAGKRKDAALKTRILSQAGELTARRTASEKHAKAIARLAEQPDDADAHLAAGVFLCFHKRDWDAGLPHLTKCAVPALKDAAARELQRPAEAVAQADLGDLWWSQSEKESGAPKDAMQQRAMGWYVEALAGLPAARQTVVVKRLQAGSGVTGLAVEKLRAAGLVFYVNPAADPTGKSRDLVTFAPPVHVGTVTDVTEAGVKALKFASSYVRYPASDAVKAIQATGSYFVWIKHTESIGPWAGVIFRGTAPDPNLGKGVADFSLFIYQEHFRAWFNWPEIEWPGIEGKTALISKSPVPVGKWTMLGATWNGTAIVLYLDGLRDRAFESPLAPLPRKFPEMVALGSDPAGAPEYYQGLMSCAMIFNRALTDAEVKQLHALSGPLGLMGPRE